MSKADVTSVEGGGDVSGCASVSGIDTHDRVEAWTSRLLNSRGENGQIVEAALLSTEESNSRTEGRCDSGRWR